MKSLLLCLSFLFLICATSCHVGYNCDCHTNSNYKTYSLNANSMSKAADECRSIRSQYGWDTCMNVELK